MFELDRDKDGFHFKMHSPDGFNQILLWVIVFIIVLSLFG